MIVYSLRFSVYGFQFAVVIWWSSGYWMPDAESRMKEACYNFSMLVCRYRL